MDRTFRLTLPLALLLLVAACSTPAAPTGPRGLRAVAGPDYAQLYWDASAGAAEYEIEYRRVDAAGDWLPAADAMIDSAAGSALIPLPEEGDFSYRVGLWHEDLVLWSTAREVLTRHDGLKLQVGTFNRGDHDPAAGTVILVWLDLPGDATLAGPIELTGPAGWAAGVHPIYVDTWDNDAGYLIEYLYELDALPGTYTVTAIAADGREWRNSVELTDADFRLPQPTDLTAAGTLTVSWRPPVAGAATQVSLLRESADSVHVATFDSSHEFTGLTGPATDAVLEVVTSNALLQESPRVMPVPFGVSNARLELE